MPDDDSDSPGFFRSLSGLATDWVNSKRKTLQTEPETLADSVGGSTTYRFGDQDLDFEDLREIKAVREDGGQVAQLMNAKALLNFGEGAEFSVEDNEDTAQPVEGDDLTLREWLDEQFPHLDQLVLELGTDALWFPYAVGETLETRSGEFKKLLPVQPWTIMPKTDAGGDIVGWHQRVKQDGGFVETPVPAEAVWSIIINKSSARDETGISEVLRSKDEIQAFKENEQAINQAIELHGFPQRHVKVGEEDGAPVRDDDLRRVRTIFDPRTTDANTAYFTGQDVDVDTLEAHQFDYTAIHEMDMRNLTTALGLPLEAGNVGSDGLGSGKPAELRFALLKLAIKANQRTFSHQFVDQVIRPIVRDYSPFDHTRRIEVDIADPLEDIGEVADLLQSVGDYMTNAEARRKLDLPEPEDDDVAESYRSPADIERDEEGVQDDPMGGLFGEKAEDAVETAIEQRDLSTLRTLQEEFDATLFELVATDEQEDFTTGDRLGIGVEFPNSGVYVDWNIDAWPEDERLDGPHVSEYATIDDAQTVAQGEVREMAAAEVAGDTDFRTCGGVTDADLQHAPEWDRPLLEMHQRVSDPSSPTDRALVSFAESATPEFVLERIREAIMSGAMFSEYDEIPSDRLMDLRQEMADSLTVDTGFTLDSITENLMAFEADLDRDEAERIARTESSAVLNSAREEGYREKGDEDGLFYWTGADPGDDRQTEACEWLIRQTNPFHGGDPVPLDELREMVAEAPTHDPDMPDNMARPESWVVHINERSTFAKAPESGV